MPTSPTPSSTSDRETWLRILAGLGLVFFLFSAWGLYDRRAQLVLPAHAENPAEALSPTPIPEADQREFARVFTEIPLDLNTATASQLTALPGIGPKLAEAIVSWRTTHGPFQSVQALDQVPGIGPKRLEQIGPYVKVAATTESHER